LVIPPFRADRQPKSGHTLDSRISAASTQPHI
jgi:hypothetical protein